MTGFEAPFWGGGNDASFKCLVPEIPGPRGAPKSLPFGHLIECHVVALLPAGIDSLRPFLWGSGGGYSFLRALMSLREFETSHEK